MYHESPEINSDCYRCFRGLRYNSRKCGDLCFAQYTRLHLVLSSSIAGAKREVLEEAGLTIKIVCLLGTYNSPIASPAILILFLSILVSPSR